VPVVECVLGDATGTITVVFMGRRRVAGLVPGAHLTVEGMVGRHRGVAAIVNPEFSIRAAGEAGGAVS